MGELFILLTQAVEHLVPATVDSEVPVDGAGTAATKPFTHFRSLVDYRAKFLRWVAQADSAKGEQRGGRENEDDAVMDDILHFGMVAGGSD